MRMLNRILLTKICHDLEGSDFDVSEACSNFNELIDQVRSGEGALDLEQIDAELRDNTWCDEMIDEHLKKLLSKSDNAQYMPVDLVSHFEYFYNTLDCDAIDTITNPFKSMKDFPVLCY